MADKHGFPNVLTGSLPDPLRDVKETLHGIKAATESLAQLGNTVKQFYEDFKREKDAEKRSTLAVSTTEARTFDADGYRFNRIYVSAAQVADDAALVISPEPGIVWTQTLTAGENVLNIPDGATYQGTTTSKNGFLVYLIKSNRE